MDNNQRLSHYYKRLSEAMNANSDDINELHKQGLEIRRANGNEFQRFFRCVHASFKARHDLIKRACKLKAAN